MHASTREPRDEFTGVGLRVVHVGQHQVLDHHAGRLSATHRRDRSLLLVERVFGGER